MILTIMMMMMTRYVVPIVVTQERVTATSISQMLNNVGQGVNIIIKMAKVNLITIHR